MIAFVTSWKCTSRPCVVKFLIVGIFEFVTWRIFSDHLGVLSEVLRGNTRQIASHFCLTISTVTQCHWGNDSSYWYDDKNFKMIPVGGWCKVSGGNYYSLYWYVPLRKESEDHGAEHRDGYSEARWKINNEWSNSMWFFNFPENSTRIRQKVITMHQERFQWRSIEYRYQ